MGEILTFSNKDSLIHARFWNVQLASKLYHEAYGKPFDSSRMFLKNSPRCIMFHLDTIVRVEDFNKELLPREPVRIKVDTAFPALNYIKRSFLPLPKVYLEPLGNPSDVFLQGLAKGVDEELEDRIRYFGETCDTLEGFQFFSDYQNYYEKGFTLNLLDHMEDEFPKASIINYSASIKQHLEEDYYRSTADLYYVGKSLEHKNYRCVPLGWGFTGEWTATDYSFESVCALGASIFNTTAHQSRSVFAPFSISFYPEYLEQSELLLDLFDFTASKQKSTIGSDIVYCLRDKDGYVPHNYSFAFEPMDKIFSYFGVLLKDEKPHYFSKPDLERDVLEEIHMLLDK